MNTQPLMSEIGNQSSGNPTPKMGYSYKEAQQITGLGRTTLWQAIEVFQSRPAHLILCATSTRFLKSL